MGKVEWDYERIPTSTWLNLTVFSVPMVVSEQSGERIGEAGSAVHSEQEEAVYTAQEEF